MANTYKYRAEKISDKKIVESVVDAASEEEASSKIQELGLKIISLEKMEHPDRRRHERLDIELEVAFVIVKGEGRRDVEFEGVTKNISAGGLLLVSEEALKPGTLIELALEISPEIAIECMGRVLRSQPAGIEEKFCLAICFVNLPMQDQVQIDQFVSKAKLT